MRRVVHALPLLTMLLLGIGREVYGQTLPPPTALPQIVIVITPTPEVWPTLTLVPTETPTPTTTATPTETPAYADFVVYATVQYGEDDPGQQTVYRYEMTAADSVVIALLAIIVGLLILDILLRLLEWRRQ